MSKLHKGLFLLVLFAFAMPVLACGGGGNGESIGQAVDRVVVDAVESAADQIDEAVDAASEMGNCVLNGSGVMVCAGEHGDAQ